MLSSTNNEEQVGIAIAHYTGDARKARATRRLDGQRLSYTQSSPGKTGDSSFETQQIWLGARKVKGARPLFRPTMREARLRLPGVPGAKSGGASAAQAGGAADQLEDAVVAYSDAYLEHGFDNAKNKLQSFLKVPDALPLDYSKAGDLTGGLGRPNMLIGEVSRLLGPVGRLPDFSNPSSLKDFRPGELLDGATFLGINFADVLLPADITDFFDDIDEVLDSVEAAAAVAKDLAKLPKTLTETVYEAADELKEAAKDAVDDAVEAAKNEIVNRIPKEIRTELDFQPVLGPDPTGIFDPRGEPGNPEATLKLHALAVAPINPPGEPTFEVTGDLRNFDLKLMGDSPFLIVHFDRLSFRADQASKPKVDVEISDITFAGALSFVNELRTFMSSPENGLSIDVGPTGVEAGYTVAIPSIPIGIFTLANISFTGGVSIPFDERKVAVRFAFCSKDAPFNISFGIFGGGGYAQIAATAGGIDTLEVALEFGGGASLDLGVASGSISLMAGIYFKLADAKGDADEDIKTVLLAGYVRLNGELDVLGLISASLEFYLELGYDGATNEAYGTATLTVEVDVLLFSGSVELSVEKRFGGSADGAEAVPAAASQANGGPGLRAGGRQTIAGATPSTFADIFDEAAWKGAYVGAFDTRAF